MSDPLNPVDVDKIGLDGLPSHFFADPKRSVKSLLRWLPGIAIVGVITVVGFNRLLATVKNRTTAPRQSVSLNSLPSTASHTIKEADTPTTNQPVGSILPLTLAVNDKAPGIQVADHTIQYTTHDPQITQLEKQWVQVTTLVDSQKQHYESELKVINDQLVALQKQLTEADDAIQALKTTQPKQLALLTSTKRKDPQNRKITTQQMPFQSPSKAWTPPLQLVSVDQWGDQTFAVLRYQGQLHAMRPGSSLLNWTLERFTESGDGIYVVNRRGQHALLSLK